MRVEFNVKALCALRGITTPTQLQKATGINYRVCYRFLGDPNSHLTAPFENISLLTVGKLCTGLHCTPGELFRIVPDSPAKVRKPARRPSTTASRLPRSVKPSAARG